jgi:hypothetical protein
MSGSGLPTSSARGFAPPDKLGEVILYGTGLVLDTFPVGEIMRAKEIFAAQF